MESADKEGRVNVVDGNRELVGGGASEVLDEGSGVVGGTFEVACDVVGGGAELVGGSSDDLVEEGSQLGEGDFEVCKGGTEVVVDEMVDAVSPVFVNVWADVGKISSENVLDVSSEVDVGGTEVVDESAEVIDVSTPVVDCCVEVADDLDEVFDVSPVVDNSTDAVGYSTEVVESSSFVLAHCDEEDCPVVVDI